MPVDARIATESLRLSSRYSSPECERPSPHPGEEFGGELGRPRAQLLHASHREGTRDELAQARVLGRVHVEDRVGRVVDLRTDEGIRTVDGQWRYSDARIVEYLTMAAFGRLPTDEERMRLTKLIVDERAKGKGDVQELRKQAFEDLLWAMLTSKEFMFNH